MSHQTLNTRQHTATGQAAAAALAGSLTQGCLLTGACASAVLRAGYYAAAISSSGAITLARPCPQKWVCPGGRPTRVFNTGPQAEEDVTIRRCPSQTWTVAPGATDLVQCCEYAARCSLPSPADSPLSCNSLGPAGLPAHSSLLRCQSSCWPCTGCVCLCNHRCLHRSQYAASLLGCGYCCCCCCCCSHPAWVLHVKRRDGQMPCRQLPGQLGCSRHRQQLHLVWSGRLCQNRPDSGGLQHHRRDHDCRGNHSVQLLLHQDRAGLVLCDQNQQLEVRHLTVLDPTLPHMHVF